MDEAVKLGKMLHETPDLFPWVCLAIVLIILTSQHKRIFAYIDARIEAYNNRQQADAVIAELIRNNTAALNNNTAALEMVKSDRGATKQLINYHETISKERIDKVLDDIAHMQTTANHIDELVSDNSRGIKIIEDRTK